MRLWQFVIVILALLTLAGCRTDPNIALLERELRLQEDELYRLKDCVEDYQISLESAQRENDDLRKQLDTEPTKEPKSSGDASSPAGPPTLVPPTIELPAEPAPEAEDTTDSKQVSQLMLNRRLTGGYNADGQPGDEGIVVCLQTRDAHGRWVAAPGEVAVVLLDPALEGEAARVARWDFTAQQTAEIFRQKGPGRAVQLEMTWPADPPIHGELHLYVRYTTTDGRKLQTDQPIQVNLPGQHTATWTPTEPRAATLQASRPQRPVWSPDRQ